MASSLPIAAWRNTWLRIVSPHGDAWAVHPADPGICEGIFPWDPPVHVISAWNPGSVMSSQEENRDRHAQLLKEISARNEEIWEGTGSAVDGAWAEVGIARIGQSLESSTLLGERVGAGCHL